MIDVLLVTHKNSDSQIITCIQSILVAKNNLLAFNGASNIRIYVGNSDAEKFSEYLGSFLERSEVTSIEFESNIYHSSGINQLNKIATSKYLFVLNPDTVLNPAIFIRFMEFVENHQNIKVVECRQLPYDHPKIYDALTLQTSWITGAAFFIEKKVFDTVGGFDEDLFPMYCNDVDLSLRMRLQGIHLYYNPELVVFHRKQVDNKGNFIGSYFERFDSLVSKMVLLHKYGQFEQFSRELNSLDITDVFNLRVKAEVERRIKSANRSLNLGLRGNVNLKIFFQNPQFGERRFE